MTNFDLPPIVAVAGGNGSGKSTVGIVREKFTEVPFADLGDFVRIEADNRGLDRADRSVLRAISTEWANELQTPAVMAVKAIQYFGEGMPFTAVSIRRPAEAEYLMERGAALVWVEAPVEVRWKRANDRARDEGDRKTLDEFIAAEAPEMHPSDPTDEYAINMSRVRKMADFVLDNSIDQADSITEASFAEIFNLTR